MPAVDQAGANSEASRVFVSASASPPANDARKRSFSQPPPQDSKPGAGGSETARVKTRLFPSGDQLGSWPSTIFCSVWVLKFQTSITPKRENAILLRSGDQVGLRSPLLQNGAIWRHETNEGRATTVDGKSAPAIRAPTQAASTPFPVTTSAYARSR